MGTGGNALQRANGDSKTQNQDVLRSCPHRLSLITEGIDTLELEIAYRQAAEDHRRGVIP